MTKLTNSLLLLQEEIVEEKNVGNVDVADDGITYLTIEDIASYLQKETIKKLVEADGGNAEERPEEE